MRPRLLLPAAVLALVVPTLTSCGLFGGGHLDDALDAMPAEAVRVEFVDRATLAERLDAEDADVDGYIEKVQDDVVVGTELVTYVASMAEGAAFDERDVEWAISGVLEDGLVTVYRVDDDVDLDELADDLEEAGLTEEELRGRRHFHGEVGEVADPAGTIGDAYPSAFSDTTIDEDEHLVVVGAGEPVLETLDDDHDSLADDDTFSDVLDGADDVEYAQLDVDPGCWRAQTPTSAEDAGATSLGAPDASAYLVAGDDAETSAVLQLGDDDAAEADAKAREAYLDDGRLMSSGLPVGDVLGADVERDGSVVRIALDLDQPGQGRRLARDRDAFFACSASD